MYVSAEQLQQSIAALQSLHPFFGTAFLAFKQIDLPIGKTRPLVFSTIMEELLQRYYRPSTRYEGFYSPFLTSSPDKRWLSPRYGSTSLQRIVSDTFADAFLHTKGESEWGWRNGYIQVLQNHLGTQRVPAFHLGAWLYRDERLAPSVTKATLVGRFQRDFKIERREEAELFDLSPPGTRIDWLVATKPSEDDIFGIIGHPPGYRPLGASLRQLKMRSVGPSRRLEYYPAQRMNLITGDNSLGKTFLLDIIWWALTGTWCQYPAIPQPGKPSPVISFTTGIGTRNRTVIAGFDWDSQRWTMKKDRGALPGLVIYARHDGSFAVWDAGRALASENAEQVGIRGAVIMSARQVWNGVRDETKRGEVPLCNGLLSD
jgi:hypothetical protein